MILPLRPHLWADSLWSLFLTCEKSTEHLQTFPAGLTQPHVETSSIMNPTTFLENPFLPFNQLVKVFGHVRTIKRPDFFFFFCPIVLQ
jgi:hypothetical protein